MCLRYLSLTNAGVIHQHGPGCPGTGHPPVEGSVNNKPTDHSDKPVTAQHITAHQDEFIDTIKSERCRLLKRIPKASRILAAEKLSTILDRIITKPDDSMMWLSVLRFSHACLAVPGGRGGRRHLSSLATKVNKALDRIPFIYNSNTSAGASC